MKALIAVGCLAVPAAVAFACAGLTRFAMWMCDCPAPEDADDPSDEW